MRLLLLLPLLSSLVSSVLSSALPSPPLSPLSLHDTRSENGTIPRTSSRFNLQAVLPRHGDDVDDEEGHQGGIMDQQPHPPSNSTSLDDVVLEPIPAHSSSSHHHHGATTPLTELNETEILLHHQPNPLSYWTHDFTFDASDERLGGRGQWGGWIIWGHALGMTVALVLLFPLGESYRSVYQAREPFKQEDGGTTKLNNSSLLSSGSDSRSNLALLRSSFSPRSSFHSLLNPHPPLDHPPHSPRSPLFVGLQIQDSRPLRPQRSWTARMDRPRLPLRSERLGLLESYEGGEGRRVESQGVEVGWSSFAKGSSRDVRAGCGSRSGGAGWPSHDWRGG